MNHNSTFGLKKRFGIIHSQIQLSMTEFYKHSLIRGCIASKDIKKGTLIVSESQQPQCSGVQNIGKHWDCHLILFPSVAKKIAILQSSTKKCSTRIFTKHFSLF